MRVIRTRAIKLVVKEVAHCSNFDLRQHFANSMDETTIRNNCDNKFYIRECSVCINSSNRCQKSQGVRILNYKSLLHIHNVQFKIE